MDPILQLVIVPVSVIGLGVLSSFLFKSFWVGPLVTAASNAIIEFIFIESLSVWTLLFSSLTFILSLPILIYVKPGEHQKTEIPK
ncbi:hypothetical protein RZN22_11030 [Bacillaceae bacterium S4-13-58]